MRSPMLLTISHTEAVFDRLEFPAAVDRLTRALHYLAADQGVTPETRVRARIVYRGDAHTPMLVSGSLLCRGPELPDGPPAAVDPDAEWLPLVTTGEPTA